VTIEKSGDDVIDTPDGPVYRVNANLPGERPWEPVKEKTVLVGAQRIPLTYRDTADMESGSYKGILLNFNTAGTDLENKHITYTLGTLEDNQLKPLPQDMQVAEIKPYPNQKSSVSVITMKLRSMTWGGYTLKLGIQVEADGVGVIGLIPITVNVVASADDLFGTPAGVYAYRASIGGPGGKVRPDGTPWPPIEEKTVLIPNIK